MFVSFYTIILPKKVAETKHFQTRASIWKNKPFILRKHSRYSKVPS